MPPSCSQLGHVHRRGAKCQAGRAILVDGEVSNEFQSHDVKFGAGAITPRRAASILSLRFIPDPWVDNKPQRPASPRQSCVI